MLGNYILVFTSAKLRLFPCFYKELPCRLLPQCESGLLFSSKPQSSGYAKQHYANRARKVSHAENPLHKQ